MNYILKKKRLGRVSVKAPYYMVCSASGQDEQKSRGWLPTQAKRGYLARLRKPAVFREKMVWLTPHNKSLIDETCSVEVAGYCFFLIFWACFWTETQLKLINTQNLAISIHQAIINLFILHFIFVAKFILSK